MAFSCMESVNVQQMAGRPARHLIPPKATRTIAALLAPGSRQVTIRPLFVRWPHVVARRHATALVQARSQSPATCMSRHSMQTATLPGPCLGAWSSGAHARSAAGVAGLRPPGANMASGAHGTAGVEERPKKFIELATDEMMLHRGVLDHMVEVDVQVGVAGVDERLNHGLVPAHILEDVVVSKTT